MVAVIILLLYFQGFGEFLFDWGIGWLPFS